MCGITGVIAFKKSGSKFIDRVEPATKVLSKRGPDDHGTFKDRRIGLGHRRLSIIDTSAKGHQPMQVPEGRYIISYNGEIYNYRELKKDLISKGVRFYTETDTEVLLQLYALEGTKCLEKLNGFFAFAIYDLKEGTVFIARDRLGIKPLLYYVDEEKFVFASEMKSIIAYGMDQGLDRCSLQSYFQLNYIPAPQTILKHTRKLLPGQYIEIHNDKVTVETYYKIPRIDPNRYVRSYQESKDHVEELLDNAVRSRLVSDVPLGAFLSGGIDSSIITALASRHIDRLHTFSIGFKDAPFFDETSYAELVAKKFNTDHTVFSLSMDDIYEHVHDIVNYIDEPFADSSAIPVNILSRETSKNMTVALSGDGADEIFSGYNKHSAWLKAEEQNLANNLIRRLHPVAGILPKSRSNPLSNKFRQLEKYGKGLKLSRGERYWLWACISNMEEVGQLLKSEYLSEDCDENKYRWISNISNYQDFNDFLLNDTTLVLPNDMLTKVDLMSMANSLEVRVPFLDHNVVEYAFSLSPDFKIDNNIRKKILQDTFQSILPAELYNRPKKGFEIPLLDWLRKGFNGEIERYVFNNALVHEQGIFNYDYIQIMKKKLNSGNPGDIHAKIWALYIFQKWYCNYFDTSLN